MTTPAPDQPKNQPSQDPNRTAERTRPRGFLSRRWVRIPLIIMVSLGALLAIAWTFESWRGHRAWGKHKEALEAKGEHFDLADFMPKPVPAEENFIATPFLAPLVQYDVVNGQVRWHDSNAVSRISSVLVHGARDGLGNWQISERSDLALASEELRSDPEFPTPPEGQTPAESVLHALGKYEPVLRELREARKRPHAVFPGKLDMTQEAAGKQFAALKGISQVVNLDALASLEAGRTADALADVEVDFRLAESLRSKPLLISHLVRVALVRASIQPIWEGLAKRRWAEPELVRLQEILSSVRLLEEYGVTMRSERAFSCEFMAQMMGRGQTGDSGAQVPAPRTLIPRGFLYQNQVAISRVFQELILPSVDAANHQVYPEKTGEEGLSTILGRKTPYNLFARMLYPAVQKSALQCASGQAGVDMARLACAIERYRIAHGQLPDSLDALGSQFIENIPPDMFTGRPLIYERHADGTFTLRSVGWNGVDDDGEVEMKRQGGINFEKGDWVWAY